MSPANPGTREVVSVDSGRIPRTGFCSSIVFNTWGSVSCEGADVKTPRSGNPLDDLRATRVPGRE